MKHDKKVIFTANTSWYLYNFRLSLATRLREQGFTVVFVAPRDGFSAKLEQAGFSFLEWKVIREGLNPFLELLSLWRLFKIYKAEQPTFVHHFTIKAVLYGSLAAKGLRVSGVANSITGLGHVFIDQSPLMRLVRGLVGQIYQTLTDSSHTRFIFQNHDDADFFLRQRMVSPERVRLVKGSGVDMGRFSPKKAGSKPSVLFVGRLIREKGIYEFLAAAKQVKERSTGVHFLVAGSPDFGNPSSISREELQVMQESGVAEFCGHVNEIEKLIAEVQIVALPSYREGLPRILLEAGSMERGLIASNVPGCREVVISSETGILVPVKDPDALAKAIFQLLEDEELRMRLGKNAREHIRRNLSDEVVLRETEKIYAEFFANQA